MAVTTAVFAAIGAGAAVHGGIQAGKQRDKTNKDLEGQKQAQAAQQAQEKQKIAKQKKLEVDTAKAEGGLAAAKSKQEKRKQSAGREGTILTDGAGPAAEASPGGEGLATTLGGAGAGAGKKNLLGL